MSGRLSLLGEKDFTETRLPCLRSSRGTSDLHKLKVQLTDKVLETARDEINWEQIKKSQVALLVEIATPWESSLHRMNFSTATSVPGFHSDKNSVIAPRLWSIRPALRTFPVCSSTDHCETEREN